MRWLWLTPLLVAVPLGFAGYLFTVPLVVTLVPMMALLWKPTLVFGFRVLWVLLLLPWLWHGGWAMATAAQDWRDGRSDLSQNCTPTMWEEQHEAHYNRAMSGLLLVLGRPPKAPPPWKAPKRLSTIPPSDGP